MSDSRSQIDDKEILRLLRYTMSEVEVPQKLIAKIRKLMDLKAARAIADAEARATLNEFARLADVAGPGLCETREQKLLGVLARIYLRFARELFEAADDLERNAGEVAKFGKEGEARQRNMAAMILREHANVMMLRTSALAENKGK